MLRPLPLPGYGNAVQPDEPWWAKLGRDLSSRLPAPIPRENMQGLPGANINLPWVPPSFNVPGYPLEPGMLPAQFKPSGGNADILSLQEMQDHLAGASSPHAGGREILTLEQMQQSVNVAPPAQAPEPEGSTPNLPSWLERRIANPFRAGVEQLGTTGAVGQAGYAADRLRTLDEIDALEAAGRPEEAHKLVAGRNDLDLSQYIAEPNPIRRQQIRDRLTGTLGGGVAEIAQRQENIAAIPKNPRLQAAMEGGSLSDFGQAILDDPGILIELTAQSLPSMAPGFAASAVAGPVAGVAGTAAGMGAGSFATESASALIESLQRQGVDVKNADALGTAFRNPDIIAKARDYATRRGLPVAAFDALSMGLASKLIAPKAIAGRVLSPLQREAANLPAQAGQQAATGAAGEAGAQLLAEGKIANPAAIGAEAAGSLGGVVMEAPFAARRLMGARQAPEVISLDEMQASVAGEAPGEPAGAQPAPGPSPTTPQPAQPAPASPGSQQSGTGRVFTPSGRAIDTQLEVIDAANLKTSHTPDLTPSPAYPSELQPRDRTRAASAEQIANIASNLRPEMLGQTADATSGAPIIGPDGVVESGNARVLAIRRAYRMGGEPGRRYRDYLTSQGFNVEGMNEPVLVRRRTTELSPEDRIAFTEEANQRATAAMSASEQAMADAGKIAPDLIGLYRGGDLASGANLPFVRGFIEGVVSPAERGAVYTREGGLSQEGLRRLENAVFARAYDDPELLASLREDTDANFKAIGSAMTDVAPAWVAMRAEAAAGTIPREMDITPDLRAAVALVRAARRKGQPVTDLLRQGDLLGSGQTIETLAILRLMFNDDKLARPASRQRVASSLVFYADQARKAEAGPSLLPGEGASNPLDILRLARNKGQGGLFDQMAMQGDVLPAEGVAEARQSGSRRPPLVNPETLSLEAMEQRINGTNRASMAPGANYTGFVSGAVTGTARADPLRREAILAPLMKSLGLPLYQGRITGKGTLGFFRMPFREIRVRRMGDIETAAHEIAHALDYSIPEIRRQWNPATNANATIRAELRGVSYDKSKLYEGFAEFVRLWATQKNQAQAKAPNFYQWWESFLNRSKHGPALRQAQEQMHEWFEQDAVTRARSKIGESPVDVNEFMNGFWDRFRQSVFDDLHGIMRAERDMTGQNAPGGAYETARLTRAAGSITEGAMLYGVPRVKPDGSHTFVGKGLKQILDPVARELDDAMMYFVGRSASELMGQGREHLFTKAEIAGMLRLETPECRTAFQEYQEWNRAILDFAQAKGIIDPAARANWKRSQYLPFHRVGQGGPVEQVQGDWAGIKALTGGTDNIKDVLPNMIGNASMLIKAALVNEARLEVVRLSKRDGGARLMVELPREDRVVRIHRNEIEGAILDALGVRKAAQLTPDQKQMLDDIIANLEPMVALTTRGNAPMGRNVVAALEHGKPRYFEVEDPILFRALTALNRQSAEGIVKVLSYVRRLGQGTVTLSLDFMAANFARDQIMAGIMSRHGYRPFYDGARGLKSRIAADPVYRDYIANGGGLASYLVDEAAFRKHIETFYTKRGIDHRTVLDSPHKLLYGLEKITDAFEVATRIGEFKKAVARGENPRHAAYSAREVSTDFAMRGDSKILGFFLDTVMFLRAGLTGMDRFYRGVSLDPHRAKVIGWTAVLAGASAALYGINVGNPLYDQLEDWERDANWHFFVPTPAYWDFREQHDRDPQTVAEAEGLFLHLRFPKIWEVGAVASIAERVAERMLGETNTAEAGARALNVFLQMFNLSILPQAIRPLYEQATNRIAFTGRPIETEGDRELLPFARGGPRTSSTLKKAAEQLRGLPAELQFSPPRAEALLRGYLNNWASMGLTLSDAMLFDDVPGLRLDQYPAVRRFYAQDPARSTRYVTELYALVDEAAQTRRTMRAMDRAERPDIADDLENETANLRYGQSERAQRYMRTFRAEVGRITTARSLDALHDVVKEYEREPDRRGAMGRIRMSKAWNDLPTLKRDLIEMWISERNAYAESVVNDIRGSEGKHIYQPDKLPSLGDVLP